MLDEDEVVTPEDEDVKPLPNQMNNEANESAYLATVYIGNPESNYLRKAQKSPVFSN
jgi:hypothetical protein